jgi:hypothetical protein
MFEARHADLRRRCPGNSRRPSSRGARQVAQVSLVRAALVVLAACEPQLLVGQWTCSEEAGAPVPDKRDPIAVPWSTGFENRFCDYTELAGFCYNDPRSASYATVTSPVHSGNFAAAFSVSSGNSRASQTRCVRQGVLPAEAYYGAWYFVPAPATSAAVWNLIHFQGGDPSAQHGLWDVSLVETPTGDLELVVYDFLTTGAHRPPDQPPVPIGAWFHLQLYLKRAADATGEVALYVDGQQLLDLKDVITDDSDWGQWYVGNYADGPMPSDSTLYVDDVTISATL